MRLWSDQKLGLDQDSPNSFQVEQSLENPRHSFQEERVDLNIDRKLKKRKK